MTTIDDAPFSVILAHTLRQRIDQLDSDRQCLSQALDALSGTHERQLPAKPRRKPGANRVSRRDSVERAMQLITTTPGLKAAQLGPKLGLAPTSGYRLVHKLTEQGRAVKADDGSLTPKTAT